MSKAPRQPFPTREATVDAFGTHVNRGKARLFRQLGFDLVMGAREGITFEDAFDGRRFINCHCNGGVFNLGHNHPTVAAALRDALGKVDIGNHHLVSGLRAELARRLSRTTGDHLQGVVYAVAGGEAVDLALKVARAHTGRSGIVSARGGYHGHTGLALATGDPAYRDPFGPNLPGFQQVPFDDVDALDRAVDDTTAAVILEPIPATLGMPVPREGYLTTAQRLCHDRGALFIVDEVQTGLGRTGSLWCYQHDGLNPDLLVTGKGLGAGLYPIAATLMTREVHTFFDDHPFVHISTFGGAELGCVAALEVLDLIEAPGFLERVRALGERFEAGFRGAPFHLRRRGLFMGLATADADTAFQGMTRLLEEGVFAIYANNDPSVLQLLPPLILTDDEADDLIQRVRRALG